MSRYVALGSSMAAGPGIRPSADGAPFRAGRSARNYPHLVADKSGLDLVDVTYSGATTANVLTEPQYGAPAQIEALNGTEDLVTVTIGGNDVGYVPLLFAAGLPRLARSLPLIGGWLREQLDPVARDRALVQVAESLKEIGRTVRGRSPRAKVLFVDYLTLLPPSGAAAPPLSDVDVALGRRVADTLERLTGEAAADTGCGWVRAADASREHHAWSTRPWTTQAWVADTGPAGAAAPQCGRHASGRRPHLRRAGLNPGLIGRADGTVSDGFCPLGSRGDCNTSRLRSVDEGRHRPLNSVQRRYWELVAEGTPPRVAGSAVGVSEAAGLLWFRQRGGVNPQLCEPKGEETTPRAGGA